MTLADIFDSVTIPTPETYDAAYPTRNQENLCYTLLQVLSNLAAIEHEFTDAEDVRQAGQQEFDLAGLLTVSKIGQTLTIAEP